MNKFGKSLDDIFKIKKNFLTENNSLLVNQNEIARVYNMQPEREFCVVCGKKLDRNVCFESHNVKYCICAVCGHVNGIHMDTKEFADKVYIQQDYGKNYRAEHTQYQERIEKIYKPKVDFLIEALGGGYAKNSMLLDVGAGSGYFVAAAVQEGINGKGVEISPQQVAYGNRHIGKEVVDCIKPDELKEVIGNTRANILSAIGVLEHLSNLREILQAIAENHNVKYLYCSLPMFSVSVILEAMSQNCFNRQLGGGHTHLFTNQSVEYMCSEYGWKIEHTWRFGVDVMDFYRMMVTAIGQNEVLMNRINAVDKSILDEIQLILDKAGLSSEKHYIIKTCN